MEKALVLKEFDRRFQRFHKHLKEEDEEEQIHALRVELKKIRALLHLLKYSDPKNSKLKIATAIKKWYQTAGDYRNLQLTLEIILDLSPSIGQTLEHLKKKKKKLLTEAASLLPTSMGITSASNRLKASIQKDLTIKNIRSFMNRYLQKIARNMRWISDDEHLHGIRKILKDFYYNREIIEKARPDFFDRLSKERMDAILLQLGRNQDLRVVLAVIGQLAPRQKNDDPGLTEIKRSIEQEKSSLKENIKKELRWLSKEGLH